MFFVCLLIVCRQHNDEEWKFNEQRAKMRESIAAAKRNSRPRGFNIAGRAPPSPPPFRRLRTTYSALLALASQTAANSTAGGGLNEPTKHWPSDTTTVGDQNTKYATPANASSFSVRRLPSALDRRAPATATATTAGVSRSTRRDEISEIQSLRQSFRGKYRLPLFFEIPEFPYNTVYRGVTQPAGAPVTFLRQGSSPLI